MEYEDYFRHSGVKGMHWGQRKQRELVGRRPGHGTTANMSTADKIKQAKHEKRKGLAKAVGGATMYAGAAFVFAKSAKHLSGLNSKSTGSDRAKGYIGLASAVALAGVGTSVGLKGFRQQQKNKYKIQTLQEEQYER